MTGFVTIGDEIEAFGHPSQCSEPASGSVESSSGSSLTVTTAADETKEIASLGTATIEVPSHGHDTDDDDNCTQFESHSVEPNDVLDSVTLNGQKLYKAGENVATDPTSGGKIDIL